MKEKTKNIEVLIAIGCATIFPLIYSIGRLLIYWNN